MVEIARSRRTIDQIIQFGRCLVFYDYNISRHFNLEISLAIPASNE